MIPVRKIFSLIIFVYTIASFTSCKKENEAISFPAVFEYQPLKIGSTYTYRLDSTITKPFSSILEIHSYHLKDSIESVFIDNENRMNYRVFRYLRDTLDVQPWKYIATYTWTIAGNNLELMENNLRYIKLVSPVTSNSIWKGNSYIETKSATSNYRYLDNWLYNYQNIEQPFTTLKGSILNTITVMHRDETDPAGAFNPINFQERNFSKEVYAKEIGLVYKDFLHWTWQVNPVAGYQDGSYGVRLNLIDYKK
jgi:hypothetical protein